MNQIRMSLQHMLLVTLVGLGIFLWNVISPVNAFAKIQHAIIITSDGAETKGSYSWIQENKSGGDRLNEHNMMATINDIRAAAIGQYYYIMEGEGLNRITCYDIISLDVKMWQYSAKDATEAGDIRPWALLPISENKAYLLRYGSSVAWIVNPLAAVEGDFKIGEIDLSAYDEGDGAPEMCCGVVVGEKAFIGLKRVDAAGVPQEAYVAVIDTATDTEIDTEQSALGGIPMLTKNPVSMSYLEDTALIYVQASGDINQPDYSGGIESVNPDSYETAMVVDDGDAADHPYGYITAMAVKSEEDGFFIGAASATDNTLYHFDPLTGTVTQMAFNSTDADYLLNTELAGLNEGFTLDQHDRLWISDIAGRRVEIINTTPTEGLYSRDGSMDIPVDNIAQTMIPGQIVFCLEPTDPAAQVNGSGAEGRFCFINTLFGN